jgi:DNA-binding FadR family transcriptional regulator
MPLGTPAPRKLVTQVADALREQIGSGEWPVGGRIPTEPELVEALGVGRNTVREAVNALVHAGLLERRQGSGTYVRGTRELDGAVARRLAEGEVAEAVEVRRAFEVAAARLAAGRRTDQDLLELDQALATREEAWRAGRVEEFIEADAVLHTAIVASAHNRMMSDLYASFGVALRASLAETIGTQLTPDRYVDHSALVEAIRSADPDGAGRAAGAFLDIIPVSGRPEV